MDTSIPTLNNEHSQTYEAVRIKTFRHANQSTSVRIIISYHATNQTGPAHAKHAMQCMTEAPEDEKNVKRSKKLLNAALSPRKSYSTYTPIIIRRSNSIPSNEPVPAQVRCRLADEKSMLQLETIQRAYDPYSIQKKPVQLLEEDPTDEEWRTSVLKYVGVRIDCGVYRMGTV